MLHQIRNSFFLLFITVLFSCSANREIINSTENKKTLQTGFWNEADSRVVSEELTKKLLNDRWLTEYMNVHRNMRPILIVGNIINSGNETIDSLIFIKDIERFIIKFNATRLIQTSNKRKELNARIANKSEFDCLETIIKWGVEQGADFIINGKIYSTSEIIKRDKIIHYKIQLTLINLETKSEVWIGEKVLSKQVIK